MAPAPRVFASAPASSCVMLSPTDVAAALLAYGCLACGKVLPPDPIDGVYRQCPCHPGGTNQTGYVWRGLMLGQGFTIVPSLISNLAALSLILLELSLEGAYVRLIREGCDSRVEDGVGVYEYTGAGRQDTYAQSGNEYTALLSG